MARICRDEAAKLIEKHGYGRRKPDLAVLNCEIDPSLENFQTACGHVASEGWWELMPRLETLVAKRPGGWLGGVRGQWEKVLKPLQKAEKAYHRERDAYLKKVEKEAPVVEPEDDEIDADEFLAQLPAEIIQLITTQTGAPADWKQWPEELKAAVVQAIMESQQEGE